ATFGTIAAVAVGIVPGWLGTHGEGGEGLPAIARGARMVTLAVAERAAVLEASALETAVTRRADTLRLDGEKRFVLQGVTADAFLVAARDGTGVSVVLVPASAPGVTIAPSSTLGKDRQSTVRLDGVSLPAAALCRQPGAAWYALERLRRTFAALLCADLVGGADAVLKMTVRYVGEREQFGAKLGTFQAVQQMV